MKNFTIEIPYKLEVIEDIRSLGFKANIGRYSGVYVMKDKDSSVIYVGKTVDLAVRIRGHRLDSDFYGDIETIEFYHVSSNMFSEVLETFLINELKPKYNKSKVYFKSQEYSERITELDYEISNLKQEISYLENDKDNLIGDYMEGDLEDDGFSLRAEMEPIDEAILEFGELIKDMQSEKYRLIMQIT